MENNTDGGIVTRGVRRVLIHPSFNVESHFSMDFGLLELDAPVPFDDCVGSVCLPTKDFPTVGTNCEVTGWGTLNMEGAVPNVLQQGLVNTVSQDICARAANSLTQQSLVFPLPYLRI